MLPHLQIKEGRREEEVNSPTAVNALLTQHRLSRSGPQLTGPLTAVTGATDEDAPAASYNEGVELWQEAPAFRQGDSAAGFSVGAASGLEG